MTIAVSPSSKMRTAFIDARLIRTRVVSETTTSAPARPTQESKQVQVNAITNAEFAVSINDTNNPKDFLIDCNLKVIVRTQESDKVLVEYDARHTGHFIVIAWTGFEDWTETPPEAFGSCFSALQYIAIRLSESTLAAMGLVGIALPRKITFDQEDSHASDKSSVETETSSAKAAT